MVGAAQYRKFQASYIAGQRNVYQRHNAGKPSPSGRGWGEGETLCAAQPNYSTDAPAVIPAQAGIQNPG